MGSLNTIIPEFCPFSMGDWVNGPGSHLHVSGIFAERIKLIRMVYGKKIRQC
jgi:hypothetical protein